MKTGNFLALAGPLFMKANSHCYQRHAPLNGQHMTPVPPSVLGRRLRDTQDWSPREKARLGTFTKEKCEVYGVPLKQRDEIIEMSQVQRIPPKTCDTKLTSSA
jgi:hypothetical protein